MPPAASKGKSKGGRESRRSRSRNTTPSSVGASASSFHGAGSTAFIDSPLMHLMVPTNLNYDDILERHGSASGIPDTKHLDTLAADLRALADLAELRGQVCDRGMRDLSHRRKERLEEEMEKERENRDAEERRERMRRETLAHEAEEDRIKNGKSKKRKDRNGARESRPLAHGAHGVARQDGLDVEMEDTPLSSPEQRRAQPGRLSSPEKSKTETASTSISSLSPSSQLHSPTVDKAAGGAISAAGSPASESSLSDEQPTPMPAIPQYQTFGLDPSTFDDPTVYHIREVTPGMGEEEIKKIYSVAQYPHDDLHDLIPGTPPDKDFSNAKPTNQVGTTTFASYVDPFLRPFTEEDLAFLRERGDRTQAFVIPRRGKKHYTEVWAEEDGQLGNGIPHPSANPPSATEPRGNIELLNDESAATDAVSSGPMLSRLLAAMRPEHRPDPDAPGAANVNGTIMNNGGMATDNFSTADGDVNKPDETPLPPATLIPDSQQPGWKMPTTRLDHNQIDERLKQELRFIGFLGEDEEPDYDAHYDDEIAARLRHLQAELKEQCIVNGARKARIAEIAKERLAHQEYSTILEDLDNQVQQSYLKRTRTLGKGKKQQKRPGGAGGGSHFVGGASASVGVSRPGIGDVARTLMERRKKWIDSVGPVFDEDVSRIPKESIFEDSAMATLTEREREGWDDGDE